MDDRERRQGKIYGDLAPWFHLLTPPEEYEEDAAFVLASIRERIDGPLATLLELGAGGGNTASHLKRDVRLTLTDVSPEMLAVSAAINPECEHLVADMRTVRLGRTFDAVLIHDAICYMTNEADLRAALATAFEHLRPGGVAVFMPDHVRERFAVGSDHGGHDAPSGRGMRYLEWITDPDPTDSTYEVDYAVLLRDTDGSVDVRRDHHVEGLFPQATWLALLAEVGFDPHAAEGPEGRVAFVGARPIPR
jgi:SAM-dependent methyltransferase